MCLIIIIIFLHTSDAWWNWDLGVDWSDSRASLQPHSTPHLICTLAWLHSNWARHIELPKMGWADINEAGQSTAPLLTNFGGELRTSWELRFISKMGIDRILLPS